METLELLGLALTLVVSLAIFRSSSKRSRNAETLQKLTVKVREHVLARRTLIEQANAFSNRPSTPFPVPLITGRRRRHPAHGLDTVPYGPHWRALRSNITATFVHPWRLGLLAPLHREAVQALVTGLRTRGSGDIVVIRDSAYPAIFAMLTRLCFGDDIDPDYVRAMQHTMHEFLTAIAGTRVFAGSMLAKLMHWRRWRRFLAFRDQQKALFLPLVAARRRRQPTCGEGNGGGFLPYVDTLIDLRIPDGGDSSRRPITDDEMVTLVVEFLAAAESIVASVEWALAHLVNRPEVQRKLRHELAVGDDGLLSNELLGRMPYLHAVVLEILRLHPPFALIRREVSTEGAVVGNSTTPPGGMMRVYFMLKDIGRDRKTWSQPDVFQPERFLAGGEGEGVSPFPGAKDIKMMPFGAGHRACPGAGLGVQYIKCFLAALVRDFEWALPAEGSAVDGVDMTELFGFVTVMKTPLAVRVTRLA